MAISDLPKPGPLSSAQIALVKTTVPGLRAKGPEIAKCMYKGMLGANPDLKNLFNNTKQQRGDQASALSRVVTTYAENLEDLTPLMPMIERLCHKHTTINLQPEQYTIVGKHLFKAFAEVLGKDVYTDEVHEAWVAAYWQLSHLCIDREVELYKDAAWIGWKDFVVQSKVKESEEITSFYLVPKDGSALPSYKPGQYVSVQHFIDSLGFKQSRQYSLSEAPNPNHFRISVRRDKGAEKGIPGCMSSLLHDSVNEGDTLEVAFPYGEFFLDDSSSPVVLISAGVGLTPLTSMLQSILNASNPRPVSWIQVVHSQNDHALNEETRQLLKAHPSTVRKTIFYSDPGAAVVGEQFDIAGRMDLAKVDDETLRLGQSDAQYYICGPQDFMEGMGKALLDKGVDRARVHAEVFGAAAAPI